VTRSAVKTYSSGAEECQYYYNKYYHSLRKKSVKHAAKKEKKQKNLKKYLKSLSVKMPTKTRLSDKGIVAMIDSRILSARHGYFKKCFCCLKKPCFACFFL